MSSNLDYLRESFEAIEGIKIDPAMPIKLNTLNEVFSGDLLNDLSFEIGGRLIVMIENQSTKNENMPLRLLQYIADLYDTLLKPGDKYRENLIALDWPEFIVFYCGEDPWHEGEDEFTLRLSDAFKKMKGLAEFGITSESRPPLELEVKVYNINKGHNELKMRNSSALHGYSEFIAKVRENEKEIADGRKVAAMSRVERQRAIARAVDWCIENHILEDFMRNHRKEVINMLYEEWNLDTAIRIRQEEAREERDTEIARNAFKALAKGISPELIQEITGMDAQTIKSLAA
jgi:hypothetical protein